MQYVFVLDFSQSQLEGPVSQERRSHGRQGLEKLYVLETVCVNGQKNFLLCAGMDLVSWSLTNTRSSTSCGAPSRGNVLTQKDSGSVQRRKKRI